MVIFERLQNQSNSAKQSEINLNTETFSEVLEEDNLPYYIIENSFLNQNHLTQLIRSNSIPSFNDLDEICLDEHVEEILSTRSRNSDKRMALKYYAIKLLEDEQIDLAFKTLFLANSL